MDAEAEEQSSVLMTVNSNTAQVPAAMNTVLLCTADVLYALLNRVSPLHKELSCDSCST